MTKVVGVRFRTADKIYFFAPGKLEIQKGQHVIVETARGVEYGYVVMGMKDVDDSNLGLKGSPTKIAKASDKVRKGAGEKVVPESPEDAVAYIVGKFKEKHIV